MILDHLIEKYSTKTIVPLYAAFIDFKSAFYSVSLETQYYGKRVAKSCHIREHNRQLWNRNLIMQSQLLLSYDHCHVFIQLEK